MIKNYRLERLKSHDIESLVALEQEFFTHAWTAEQFLQAVESKHYLVYGIKEGGTLLSYCIVRTFPEIGKARIDMKGEFEILNIATRNNYQKKGLADNLLHHIIKLAIKLNIESIYLDVRLSNIKAISLYSKHLFVEIARRKNYYLTDIGKEDALIMQRKIC